MVKTIPVIAHMNGTFFDRTNTFIYNYLVKFKRSQPICISTGPIENINQFPFPESDLYTIHHESLTIPWLIYGATRRLTGRRYELEKILNRRNARLLHAHFGPTGYFLIKSKEQLGLPLITTFYGKDTNPNEMVDGKRDWRKMLFESGDLFLVEGPHMLERLTSLGCPQNKIQIQRIAIPVKDMPFRLRKEIKGKTPIVLFAGRFVEKKGLLYALAAVNELARIGISIEFRIIGDGPLNHQIMQYIDEHSMASYTHMLGFLDHTDYLREMDNADIFLHPSITAEDGDTEGGAPTVILEAQAMGLPIVSTYHCDIPNIVSSGQKALLVEERNSPALASVLRELIENKLDYEHMSSIGRKHVERFHNIETEVQSLEDKYLAMTSA